MAGESSETTPATARNDSGRYRPGKSGNPGGRPKLTGRALEVRAACREASVRAVERLTELLEAADPGVVLRAATVILDRAWGSPGSEADVREVDTDRLDAAKARKQGRGRDALAELMAEQEPPLDVDGPTVGPPR